MKSDLVAASTAANVSGEIDKMDCGGGTNKLGQLYFKVRYRQLSAYFRYYYYYYYFFPTLVVPVVDNIAYRKIC